MLAFDSAFNHDSGLCAAKIIHPAHCGSAAQDSGLSQVTNIEKHSRPPDFWLSRAPLPQLGIERQDKPP